MNKRTWDYVEICLNCCVEWCIEITFKTNVYTWDIDLVSVWKCD